MTMRVFRSRYTPGLKPGMGAEIAWELGETVVITDGQDAGRQFVICSEGMSHDGAPGELIREGYFVDDPTQELHAKVERLLWFDTDRETERQLGMVSLGLKEST